MSRYEDLKSLVEDMESDMDKFYNKGNKTAGTRARKSLQELKNMAQDIRVEIQTMKKEA
jgi:hypothetical protein